LKQPERAGARWLGKTCVLVAWVGLALAIVTPPHGLGFTICWIQHATGLPCPGCGMTRSLSCALRGMFPESWHYHPMGLFVLALFIFTAAQSLLPRPVRGRIIAFIDDRATVFNSLYLAFVVVFVTFGVVRALVQFSATWMR
jgi:hypothetical protein